MAANDLIGTGALQRPQKQNAGMRVCLQAKQTTVGGLTGQGRHSQ